MTDVGSAANDPWLVTGSAAEWLRAIIAFSVYAFGSAALGAVAACLVRRRRTARFLAAAGLSGAFFVAMVAASAVGLGWTPQHPFASALHLTAPFVLFFFAPALLASSLVRRWVSR